MTSHEKYMLRCVELARQAAGYVAPNPMVGAVLVHDDKIIGEGYHQLYGGPHAEVHCINSVDTTHRHLISSSTIYVSLEPCAHYGKTPPCADLIIRHKIPRVVIGCRDPFKDVNGKGIEKLEAAGIKVIQHVLEEECRELNKRFFTFNTLHRPYIILKWAQTADNKIGYFGSNRLRITNEFTNKLVHKWRSEEAAIMIGTNTAALDDPQLTNRLWSGPTPARIIIDYDLRLPNTLKVFDKSVKTIVFNTIKHGDENGIFYYQVTDDVNLVHQVTNGLYQLRLMSVIIEGGAQLTQSFIDENYWDEARIITNKELRIGEGVAAPTLNNSKLIHTENSGSDIIRLFKPVAHH
jgi:diaminohydroxyphosphoribosylaminopyrimidine deaminase / 5-amino-6-(5-phosphoribosylamino)uracil reductase